jgi:alcohol dehydrogenase
MQALVFDEKLELVKNMAKPSPAESEALVKVLMAGICNTDLEIERGYMGFKGVLGHEFVGLVEEVNGADHGLIGKRVVGDINCGCGKCSFCLQGMNNHCPERVTVGIDRKNGCLAEYLTMPVGNLFIVPASVSDEEAVFAEPLAAAFEILEQVHIKPTDLAAVLGDGKLGLLIALVLKQSQADLFLIGKHPHKLAIAAGQKIKTALLGDLPRRRLFNLVVEATGSVDGFELAQELLKPRGTLVLKSTVAGSKNFNLTSLVLNEITVIGSRCGPFPPALRALENKAIDVRPLISKVYSSDKALEAFEAARAKDSLKVLVDFR